MDKSSAPNALFPFWLMRSKAHPTKQRVDRLDRPALLKQLDECLEATLTLVHAPAGYGKSTLLADWRNTLLQNNTAVCWLSLDREDNDPFQLLTYIAFSLSEGGVDFTTANVDNDTQFKDLSTRNFLSLINHVIDAQDNNVVLILDDFETLDAEAVDGIIKPLLDYAPANFHVAIASRDDSKLKITNLETHGQVVHIKSEAMRFTLDELNRFFADEVNKKTIEQIYRLTEGWPVTLQLIKSSLKRRQDNEQILSSFSGTSRPITAYLSEQIFNELSDGLQQFLMDISVLGRVSVEVADRLRDTHDSAQGFEGVKALNTLVLPVEKVENTYRLHPLFRDFLYDRLMVSNPERAGELHGRAADWFAQQGDIVKAVGQAIRAKQPSKAVAIIEAAGGVILWLKEGLTRLRAVLALLDKETIQASPRLMSIQCLMDIKDGRVFKAHLDYDAAAGLYHSHKPGLPEHTCSQIEHEFLLVESLLACCEGKALSESFCQQLKRNIQRIPPDEHTTLGHHFTLLCLVYVQRGMFKEARRYAEKAVAEFKQFRSVYGEVYINFHLGDISFAGGSSENAEHYYRTGLDLARKHFNDDKGIKLVANVLIAELKYELDRTQGLANTVATIPKQLEAREAWFDIYAAGYVTASNIEYERHGLDAALSVLDRAAAYANGEKLTRLADLLVYQRMELLLRADSPTQAKRLLTEANIDPADYAAFDNTETPWRECDLAIRAISRLRIKEGQLSEALSLLSPLTDRAHALGHNKSCIHYEILQSLAYAGQRDTDNALLHLDKALALSAESGFIRAFKDEKQALTNLLQLYAQRHSSPVAPNTGTDPQFSTRLEQADKLLALFNRDTEAEAEDDAQLLSKREHQVLAQLVQGYSNKVIARNIDISENTVRFHLKNIFTKLQVDNRLQAVTAAQKRKLI